jgi:hypothetical protein
MPSLIVEAIPELSAPSNLSSTLLIGVAAALLRK